MSSYKSTKRFAFNNISLRWLLVVPFVLQIVGAVCLVGYLSYRSGETAVENLAEQVMDQVTYRIHDRLDTSLQISQQAVAVNHLAAQQGRLNLSNLEQLRDYLWQQIQLSPSLSSTNFVNERGEEVTYVRLLSQEIVKQAKKLSGENLEIGTLLLSEINSAHPTQRKYYLVDDRGKPKKLVYALTIDSRTTPWYQAAKSSLTQGWSPIYIYRVIPSLGISAVVSVYDGSGKFAGVFTNGVALSEIGTFLNELNFSPSGQTFILDRRGDLVATSTLETPYIKQDREQLVRLPATQSQDARTRAIATQLRQQYRDLDQIKAEFRFKVPFEGTTLFAQIQPYRDRYGLDWLLVTAIPESDFMAEIQASTNQTIFLCGITLLVATAIGFFTAHWITTPILRLSRASKAMALGEWQVSLPEDSKITELKTLSESFNMMSVQLHQSFERIEIALQESKEKYKVLFHTIPIGIAITDRDGKILDGNPASEMILGIPNPEITTRTYDDSSWQILRPDGSPMPVEEFASVIALRENRFVRDVEMEIARPDGERRSLRVSAVPIPLEQYGVAIAYVDISNQKKAETALKNTLQELSYHIENSPLAVLRWNREFRLESWSKQAERMFGWKADEVLGKSTHDWQFIYEDDLAYVNKFTTQLLSGKSTFCQNRNYHKNGSVVYCEWYNSSLIDEKGNLISILSFAQDVTEREYLERELIKNRDFRELLFNEASDALFLVNSETLLTLDCNKKAVELFEVSSKTELLNIEGHILQKRQFTLEELDAIQQEIDRKGYWSLELEYISRQGREFWGDISVKLITFGELRFNLVRVVDITERKQAEIVLAQAKEAAETATRAKSEFLANMSHEIRTPMNGVLGMAQLLSATKLTDEQKEFVQTIQDSGDALLILINDILDFSKIESGKFELVEETIFLENILKSVCNLLSNQARAKDIDLQYLTDPNLPVAIKGDGSRLRQILLNLVGNAIKFTQQGNVFIFASSRSLSDDQNPECELMFAIEDSGIGIESELIDKLFQPFTQADASISRKYGGTGLGLAISKSLVELMGGKIWVESLGFVGGNPPLNWEPNLIGRGTTFYFTITGAVISAIEPSPKMDSIPTLIDSTMAERLPLQILLVEDIPINQKLASYLFRKLGYHLDLAHNGFECIQMLKERSYEVILMDIQMPVIDGLTATEIIRSQLKHASQPWIIAMTANALPEDRQKCMDAGMNDYISKPIQIEEIIRALTQSFQHINQNKGIEPQVETKNLQVPQDQFTSIQSSEVTMPVIDMSYFRTLYAIDKEDNLSVAEIHEILGLIINDLNAAFQSLQSAIAQLDAAQVSFHAHSLKSLGSMFRAIALVKRCVELEAMAKLGNVLLTVEWQQNFLTEYEQVIVALTQEYQRHL